MSPLLPRDPDLNHLKKQAKELVKAHKAQSLEACRRIQEHLPRLLQASPSEILRADFALSDAQLVIAREHDFPSWPKLKEHIESLRADPGDGADAVEQFKDAVTDRDAGRVSALLKRYPSLAEQVNTPLFAFDSPAIVVSRENRALVDVLLEHGADINARSQWWAGGFGVLDGADPEVGAYLISRGAIVDVHAAAGLGMLDRIEELIRETPELVNAKGGDGQRPLHFAQTPEMIDFLLDHGAEIDARDVDHESTPAQYAVPRPPAQGKRDSLARAAEKCRHLIKRGAEVDIFMACALGDVDLVRAVLESDPESISARIGDGRYKPVPSAPGGHIYIYNLAANASPHQVAAMFSHQTAYDLLLERSPVKERFLAACARGDETRVRAILAAHPDLVASLPPGDARLIADAAWENDIDAARVMLHAGFDPHTRGVHESTPLDRAAFHGFVDMVKLLLRHDPNPPLELRNEFGSTPLGTCIHGSIHSWRKDGDHAAAAEDLIAAGAKVPERAGGSEAVAAVLRRHGAKD